MAKPLDRNTYKRVEWHLHHEKQMQETVAAYEADILLGSTGTDWGRPVSGRTGTTADLVSGKAMRLAAPPAEVRAARRWLAVIGQVRQWFDGAQEARLFVLFYGATARIEMVAAALGTSRRVVEQLRDNVVYRAAMMAAAERLIRF